MTDINKTFSALPPKAKKEVIDFIEFLSYKYKIKKISNISQEKQYWLELSEKSLKKIWDNKEDDVYNELLKR